MDYSEYTVEDFIEDALFVKWVLRPTSDIDLFWENWLRDHREKLKVVQEARDIILAFQYKEHRWDEESSSRVWAEIERLNATDESGVDEGRKIPSDDSNRDLKGRPAIVSPARAVLKWAAVFAGILVVSVFTIYQIAPPLTEDKTIVPLMVSEVNPGGQKSKVFLPDGSIVYLNGETRLSYANGFSNTTREVRLSGEAFFEVARDSLRPFVVITGKLITTALGTSFNCKAYPEEKEVTISLLTGRVSVRKQSGADSVLFLESGEAAGLDKEGVLTEKEFDYEGDILWKDGILSFKETLLKDVLKRFEKWYGVSFTLENHPSHAVIVTGRFDNESLNNVLLNLSYTSNFVYTIDHKNVIITFK
jgi:transmembrane sensor